MRSARSLLAGLMMLLSASAFAQSDAKQSFDKLKALAGTWQGVVAGTGSEVDGRPIQLTLRITSMGNALMHEMKIGGRPDDPITMFYIDGDRLLLTHYCDAGNRPRMSGTSSPDGKTVDFAFVDVTGNMQYGHMHHAVFSLQDATHHREEWTFMEGEKPVHVHFDLQRVQ